LAGAPVFRKNDSFCGCRLPGNKVRERFFSHLEVLLNLAFRISFDLAESPLRAEKTAHFRSVLLTSMIALSLPCWQMMITFHHQQKRTTKKKREPFRFFAAPHLVLLKGTPALRSGTKHTPVLRCAPRLLLRYVSVQLLTSPARRDSDGSGGSVKSAPMSRSKTEPNERQTVVATEAEKGHKTSVYPSACLSACLPGC
jgi:hypothetical protein